VIKRNGEAREEIGVNCSLPQGKRASTGRIMIASAKIIEFYGCEHLFLVL
jgi:hypothetical protein